jgi:Transglycosylase SLT domain
MFAPSHRLSGIGVDRRNMSDEILEARARQLIDSQTFTILRDPRALSGAQRITSAKLDRLFREAERRTGVPARLVSAVSYLESWGDPNAESPTGPRGLMQISAATAKTMGLKVVYATRYRVTKERRTRRNKRGRMVTRTVRVKTPYTVLVRDERLIPEKAIPAAAQHLARLQAKFGGMDWAIFAYHCGEGCVATMRAMTDEADEIKKPPTVAKMFFGGSPAFNRELNAAVQSEMERDYSPTYWFRVMKAEELLDLYREDPKTFQNLAESFRYNPDSDQRAPHRLAIWLKREDLVFQKGEDLRREQGRKLQHVFDDPKFFGFNVRKDLIASNDRGNQEYYLQDSPAALGALVYIAFETRRLHEAMHPHGETFVPLDVTSLVRPLDDTPGLNGKFRNEAIWHGTGEVFDIAYGRLPKGERLALRFVLDDMGYDGYLGFVEEGSQSETMHIGAAPTAREFFTSVFAEALAAPKG